LETRRSGFDAAANVALLVLIIISFLVSGAVIYRLPAQTENKSGPSTASSPASTSTAASSLSTSKSSIFSGSTSYTTISSPTVPLPDGQCLNVSTTLSFGQITIVRNPCVSYGFPNGESENLTLTNPQVFPFIKTAYSYGLTYVKYIGNDRSIMDFVLNVTGTQTVKGNWSTAYSISYTGNKMMNVTLQSQTGGVYKLLDVVVVNLPDRNYAKAFTLEQRQIIRTALSNSTVEGLMVDPPYYVREVTPFSNGTGLGFGEFFVWLFQVNGIREVGTYVTGNITGVVSAYSDNRVSTECFAANSCFVDPWGVDPNAGIAREPFYVYLNYDGQWTANVSIYNSGQPYGKQVFNHTFSGDGNDTLMIPFQDVVGSQTILVTAQKLDDGTRVLSVRINWGPGVYPGGGAQASSTNQFRGTTSAYFDVG
jgi:hypothetical protein